MISCGFICELTVQNSPVFCSYLFLDECFGYSEFSVLFVSFLFASSCYSSVLLIYSHHCNSIHKTIVNNGDPSRLPIVVVHWNFPQRSL